MQVQRNRVICIYINKCSRSDILVDWFRNLGNEKKAWPSSPCLRFWKVCRPMAAIWLFSKLIPDPGSDFFSIRVLDPDFFPSGSWIRIPDPEVKKAPGPGSATQENHENSSFPLPEILEGLSPDGGYLVVLKVEPAHEAHAAEAVPVQPADAVPAHLQHRWPDNKKSGLAIKKNPPKKTPKTH